MLIIPAIDLKDGQCVRLKQGLMEQATVFSESPGEQARHWLDQGARRLHLVDLNGAFAGKPKNQVAIKAILKEVGDEIPVQLGGGIRDTATVEAWLDKGVTRVIIGTAAVRDPPFVKQAARDFPGRIAVGLDAKGGRVATEGWAEVSDLTVLEMARRFEDAGVAALLFTDVGRDGLLKGCNVEATVALARAVSIPVIASGGVSGIDEIHVLALHARDGVEGVITGRALYDGRLDLAAALNVAAAA